MRRALTGPLSFGLSKAIASPEGVGDIIASLFADGTDGFYFDFSKTDRLFQEITGPTPADGGGENIGLALEAHSWAGKTLAQVIADGAQLVANGDFSGGSTSWTNASTGTGTFSVSSGSGTIVGSNGSNRGGLSQNIGMTVGAFYELSFAAVVTSGAAFIGGISVGTGGYGINAGSNVLVIKALAASLVAYTGSGGGNVTLDNISVKAIPGNHGLQATTASQPKWQTGGLARFDGSDDNLLTTLTPASEMTLIFKCKLTGLLSAGAYLTASRVTGTDSRFYLGFDASEQLHTIVGVTTITRTGSLYDTLGVAGLVLSGGLATLYWNGVEGTPAAVGSPNTTIPLPIGALNISSSIQSFFPGDIYHALAIKKALTAAQIAAITNLWGTS